MIEFDSDFFETCGNTERERPISSVSPFLLASDGKFQSSLKTV